ncbi:hypothetical protein A33Q_1721 [Indibacter alkaliphilus LW1]|uniref:Uncharacterized protein n=1 Tax=Indibacter alkaliphilus (strain CCUG 57479 / KCTC 22604 / LW1) TaxID=1189612 RepID=S2E645_INDAL|nr:hypothetical protein A33Q_1721 [Indibacter alkaliphilus LW1]
MSGRQYYLPAGIGTLDFPGCQRVNEPVSRLFCINPSTKSERMSQRNKLGLVYARIKRDILRQEKK